MNNNILNELSDRIGRDKKSTQALLEALRSALIQTARELKSVAIPGFGTFTPEKRMEQVSRDLSTGRAILLPPEVVIEFSPASKLRKIAGKYADI